ncbi:diguanylate cyclase [Alkalibaculum sp. M08DMB]|uniref:Diguanylate cyclase n=1 Tax=Alkalibaculum sporogenes TaxID=2655001 RepID=A0A6A7K5L3_9FIRM|nr:sensor domain-containing diguanylate cyclase [Alkalibaculum sporogenes]MPW24672.1 diguanylate cyclase [Alkalibaculum sporogenes]
MFNKLIKSYRLRKSRKLIIAMKSLENIPDGVFWVDKNRQIMYVNSSACKTLGYSKSDLMAMTVGEIDGSEEYKEIENYKQLQNDIKEGEITHFTTYHKHSDGHLIPVEIVSASIELGEQDMGLAIVRDITERIKLENEINNAYIHLSLLNQIYEFSETNIEELDIQSLLNQTIGLLQKEFKGSGIVFHLYNDCRNELILYDSIGLEKEIKSKLKTLPKEFIRKSNIDYSYSFNYNEFITEEELALLINSDYLNSTFSPIFVNKKFYGGISILNKDSQFINVKNKELVASVCTQLSTIIKNLQLRITLNDELDKHKKTGEMLKEVNDELEKSAYLDQLTNVWNRRYLLNNVNAQIDMINSQQSKIALLLLDIDYFKHINDNFGHKVGDDVLIEFANLIKNQIRSSDILTRWGGEEFLVLAPHMNAHDAMQYAERLRKSVAEHKFSIIGSMTVSIGVAELVEFESLDCWINRVDSALYIAKDSNRNKVVLSEV